MPPDVRSAIERDLVERYGRPAVNLVAIIILAVIALQAVRLMGFSPDEAPAPVSESAPPFATPQLPIPTGNSPVALLRNHIQAQPAERSETTAQVLRAWLSEN